MKKILLSCVVVCIGCLAFAQPLPPGVEKKASVEGITEYALPNGLRVLLFPDASKPKVTVNMTYLVGSLHEGYGESGMAHLLEHLLFLQTNTRSDIKQELKDHGASWNGTTHYDRTNYFETVAANEENLKWAIQLEADRMVNAKMEKPILDREMTVVRNEFELVESRAESVLYLRTLRAAYGWHKYGSSVVGTRSDIENVPIERLAAFYRKYYRPDNAVLAIAGAFDPAKTLAWVVEALGALPRPAQKLESTYTVEPVQDGQRMVELRRVGGVPSVMFAYHTPAASHPDTAALDVLAGILGDTPAGRLHKTLVDGKKAVSVWMYCQQLHDPGVLMANVSLAKGQSPDEARRAALQVIEGVASQPATKEEVDRVKTSLLKTADMVFNNPEEIGLWLSEWISYGDWRLMFLHRDHIRSVTGQDVERVAKRYLKESNRTTGVFLPAADADRAEIPPAPDVYSLVKDYKGGAAVSGGEAFDPTPANVESRVARSTLPNGLKIVLLPKKTRGGTVKARLAFRFGDEKSLFGQQMAGHMAAAMLMRGTRSKSRQQIQEEMDRLKAQIDVLPGGPAGAQLKIETVTVNLAATLRLAAEILREPAFAEGEFAQMRQQRLAGIERMRMDPASTANRKLSRHMNPYLRGDQRYVSTTDEEIEDARNVTLDQVREFHRRFWGIPTGGEAAVAVSGQFDVAEVRKLVAELFGDWKTATPYHLLAAEYLKREPINVALETPDKQNAYIQLQMLLRMNDSHPDYPAMTLAGNIFGRSISRRIRDNEGLSYGVGSNFQAWAKGDRGTFGGFGISAPQNTPKVEASFRDELERTLRGGFTAGEVAAAKKSWLQTRTLWLSDDAELAGRLANLAQNDRTMAWEADLEQKVAALTAEQVSEAFRRHIDPKALSIVKAGDFKRVGVFQQ